MAREARLWRNSAHGPRTTRAVPALADLDVAVRLCGIDPAEVKRHVVAHKAFLRHAEGGERWIMRDADLCHAKLSHSILYDANMKLADVTDADLKNAEPATIAAR